MSLKFGKRDINKMVEAIDREFDTAEEAAEAALEAAMQIIEARAKFTVVGQVRQKDNKGDKIALGWYSTENQATQDALKLTYSSQTHEEHLAWVLPLHHGTPNDYYISRKKKKQAQATADLNYRERELQRRIKWVEDNPGAPIPSDWGLVPYASEVEDCQTCHGTGKVRQQEGDAA